MGLLNKIFGTYSEKQIKKLLPIVDKIEELEEEILPIPHQSAPKGEPIDYGHYGRIVSAGVLTMSM